jgi:lysophospholipase L1-like esterase
MKRVLLLGDTIRLGYQEEVRSRLSDLAIVHGPAENGQHTANLLFHLWSWAITQDPDVIHLNAGHWDSRRVVRGEVGNVVAVGAYRDNVRRILAALVRHTRAKIIWATTTPVQWPEYEVSQTKWGTPGRDIDSIETYNKVAVEEAAALGVAVNDLHAFVHAQGQRRMMHDDGAHFSSEGYSILGKEVARVIRTELERES